MVRSRSQPGELLQPAEVEAMAERHRDGGAGRRTRSSRGRARGEGRDGEGRGAQGGPGRARGVRGRVDCPSARHTQIQLGAARGGDGEVGEEPRHGHEADFVGERRVMAQVSGVRLHEEDLGGERYAEGDIGGEHREDADLRDERHVDAELGGDRRVEGDLGGRQRVDAELGGGGDAAGEPCRQADGDGHNVTRDRGIGEAEGGTNGSHENGGDRDRGLSNTASRRNRSGVDGGHIRRRRRDRNATERSNDSRSRDDRNSGASASSNTTSRNRSSGESAASRRRTGRRKHESWNHFTVTDTTTKHPAVSCNYCPTTFRSAQPGDHLIPHLQVCMNAPQAVRIKYASKTQANAVLSIPLLDQGVTPVSNDAQHATSSESPSIRRVCICQNNPIPSDIKAELDMKVADMVFLDGLAFTEVSNPGFTNLINFLVPSYKPPKETKVAGALLEHSYDLCKKETIDFVKSSQSPFFAIVTDSYKSASHESVVNFVLASPMLPSVFWKSQSTGQVKHSSRNLKKMLVDVIDEVHGIFGQGKVCAVLADNASNMRKACEDIERANPGIRANGCAAHGMNLLAEAIFKIALFDDTLKKATVLTRFLRNRAAVLDRFRTYQKNERRISQATNQPGATRKSLGWLVMPVSTRWYSSLDCISVIVANKGIIKGLFANDEFIQQYVSRPGEGDYAEDTTESPRSSVNEIVSSNSFWDNAEFAVSKIGPVTDCIAILESDVCCASKVYDRFKWLLEHEAYRSHRRHFRQSQSQIPEVDVVGEGSDPNDPALKRLTLTGDVARAIKARIKFLVNDRWEKMHTDSMAVAYLLDPSMSTSRMVNTDRIDAINQATDIAADSDYLRQIGKSREDFHFALRRFVIEKDRWSEEQLRSNGRFSPLEWWMLNKEPAVLHAFALRILCIPTSSAASERAWSMHKFIHSNRRSRLKDSRVSKLVYKYSNHGLKSKKTRTLAFHAGPRLCVGRDLAMLQMKILVSTVLARFKLREQPGIEVTYVPSATLPMKNPLLINIERV